MLSGFDGGGDGVLVVAIVHRTVNYSTGTAVDLRYSISPSSVFVRGSRIRTVRVLYSTDYVYTTTCTRTSFILMRLLHRTYRYRTADDIAKNLLVGHYDGIMNHDSQK